MSPTKWGVCGAGRISGTFCNAVTFLPKGEHELVAVGARDLKKANEFAEKYSIKKSYGSYDEIARDQDIEVVYIGTINTVHYDLCILMMEHGKHVLCEKPLTMNAKLAEKLINVAREKKVFFMEGYWSRLFPAYKKIREEIAAGKIGKPMKINVNFAVKIYQVPRLVEKKLGGGALLDIGVYPIQFAIMIFREDPEEVQAMATLNDDGVDLCDAIQMKFSGNRFVQIYCDSRYEGNTSAMISGTDGTIQIDSHFWCPTKVTTPSGTFDYPLPGKAENFPNDQGFLYQIDEVRRCLLAGLTECPEVPLEDTLRIAQIVDKIRQQTGVVYDQD